MHHFRYKSYVLKQRNSKKQGDVGLGNAISYFTIRGYTVCVPLTDSQDYDLVVDIEDAVLRVQVKTTTYRNKNGSFCVNLSIKGGNQSFSTIKKFNSEKVDYLYILTEEGDRYFIPTIAIEAKSQLVLGPKYKKWRV